ncbi:MAG: IS6 family transposase [Candidatus Bathyarchaeota archaeon]|nr:IS6 family transposase [Candidatus Bathyarchaeota archaeon]
MITTQTSTRLERGQAIAQHNGQVSRIDDMLYIVKSQSGNGEYTINKVNGEWTCTCPDNTYRHTICKHIHAVDFSTQLRTEVKASKSKAFVVSELTAQVCQCCGSSNLKKDGIRHNKSGSIQKFLCRECGHYFTINIGFERMKHNPKAITAAMQLYFSGESLRNTQRSLKLLGVEVSHKTVFMWIKKYSALMKDYADRITPNVGDKWRADEVYIKVAGNMKYLFAVMDDETRFLIAQEVAETKHQHDAKHLFQMATRLMEKQPKIMVTDGLPSYHVAAKQVLKGTEHVREIRLAGSIHNNKMERLNGEIRDREKTMRGLKVNETPILTGYQLYHNYIRPHESLDGKTPADLCGIKIEGANKWLTLIQNAAQKTDFINPKIER